MKRSNKPTSATAQACAPMPDFERLNYYYGQALGVDDFKTEQAYFLGKLRLYNRCFHGYGIVCGLEVTPLPANEECEDDLLRRRKELEKEIRQIDARMAELEAVLEKGEDPEEIKALLAKLQAQKEELQRRLDELPDCSPDKAPVPAEVCINCGLALDCQGREIVVRQPQKVDLRALLSAEQWRQIKAGCQGKERIVLELSICYCEQPTYPSRPVLTDTCAAVSKCVYGRTREGFKFRVSLTPSEPYTRCDTCCQPCEEECLVLARIHWDPLAPITWEDIDYTPRRGLSLYAPTVITGVSWRHGAHYDPDQAKEVLGTARSKAARTDGLEVIFSRPVQAETLQPGVVDLWRIQGGAGLSGVISHIAGSFVDKPDTGLISSFKYRDESGETLNIGDRVLIIIRGNFILDACCRPLDGEHVGGRVPQLEAYRSDDIDPKSLPPAPACAQGRHQPWTSGNNRPGATFESWFFII